MKFTFTFTGLSRCMGSKTDNKQILKNSCYLWKVSPVSEICNCKYYIFPDASIIFFFTETEIREASEGTVYIAFVIKS